MVASSAAAKLRSEICALDLIKRLDLLPGFIAYGARHIDLESHDRHEVDAKEKKLDLEFPAPWWKLDHKYFVQHQIDHHASH